MALIGSHLAYEFPGYEVQFQKTRKNKTKKLLPYTKHKKFQQMKENKTRKTTERQKRSNSKRLIVEENKKTKEYL